MQITHTQAKGKWKPAGNIKVCLAHTHTHSKNNETNSVYFLKH